jgi:hypothetical protein
VNALVLNSPQTCICPLGGWQRPTSPTRHGAALLTTWGQSGFTTWCGRSARSESEHASKTVYTDDGQVHEHRGLKGRTKGRPVPRARRPVGKVPIPPELTGLLRAHLAAFGLAPDGRLFRSENGNPLQPSTWWQVWQKVRATPLTPDQLASPLMKRPYDLRHSGVTWRLNSGVPATEVAAWAGHSMEVLT